MTKTANAIDLFQLIDRKSFDELVERWEMDKWVRKLKTWELTCALVSAITMKLDSFREIEQIFSIPRATLGDALAKRCSGFFMDLCDLTLLRIREKSTDRKTKRAIREILALDSSEVRLHGSMFSKSLWKQRNSLSKEAAAKIHVVWNVSGKWIEDFRVTGSRQNDSPVSRYFTIRPNCTYVFDRAYNNLRFWFKIMDANAHFVTRLKERSVRIIENAKNAELSSKNGILYDGVYSPSKIARARLPRKYRFIDFRFIIYRDPLTRKIFYFVTSDWKAKAQTIADMYRDRWAVELLFRWLKGHLKIRYLPIKSVNGAQTQLAIAVLTQLLLQLKKILSHYQGTLWELLREIRLSYLRKTLDTVGPPDGCRWKLAPRATFRVR